MECCTYDRTMGCSSSKGSGDTGVETSGDTSTVKGVVVAEKKQDGGVHASSADDNNKNDRKDAGGANVEAEERGVTKSQKIKLARQESKKLKLEEKNGEGGRRSYTLLDAEVLLVVNHTVRLSGLRFDPAKGGPAGRVLRGRKEAAAKIYYISRETHHSLLSCCS